MVSKPEQPHSAGDDLTGTLIRGTIVVVAAVIVAPAVILPALLWRRFLWPQFCRLRFPWLWTWAPWLLVVFVYWLFGFHDSLLLVAHGAGPIISFFKHSDLLDFDLPHWLEWAPRVMTGSIVIGLILSVFGGPVFSIFAILFPKKSESLATHGSARWGKDFGHALRNKGDNGGLLLGRVLQHVAGKLDNRFTESGHVLTIAPTGAGKGIGCVIPNLLHYVGSIFCLDIKGENWAVTHNYRQNLDHEVCCLDPFKITGQRRDSINWLDLIDPTDEGCVTEAKLLADMLVIRNSNDSHWDESAADIIQAVVLHVAGLDDEKHMGTVRDLLMRPDRMKEDLIGSTAAFGLVDRSISAFFAKEERERSGILSTAQRHTAFLDDPRILGTLRTSTIDFRKLKSQKGLDVFLCIPPAELEIQTRYVRATLSMALRAVSTPGLPKHKVLFLLDEFAGLGYFAPVEKMISLMRGYGVTLWLLVQDLSQLQAVYPKWKTFLANMTLQAFGAQDHDTAEYLSKMLGQQTIETESKSASSSARTSGGGGGSSGRSTSTQATGRPLMMPDEVRTMNVEHVLVIQGGRHPFKLGRLNYLKDPETAGRYEANPMHEAY